MTNKNGSLEYVDNEAAEQDDADVIKMASNNVQPARDNKELSNQDHRLQTINSTDKYCYSYIHTKNQEREQ